MSKILKSPPEKAYYMVEVEAGKTYFWCACGKSKNAPFCDGSHSGSEFNPVRYEAETNKVVSFCWCHKSKTPPLCDGSHKEL